MNRVNMKQTVSTRESSNYAAIRELNALRQERETLLQFEANETLSATGKRQLARCEKKITEIESETN